MADETKEPESKIPDKNLLKMLSKPIIYETNCQMYEKDHFLLPNHYKDAIEKIMIPNGIKRVTFSINL